MLCLSIILAMLAGLGAALPSEKSFKEVNTLSPRAVSYPAASGLLFNIDGVTKYYAGTNAYWISFLTNNDDVDLVMSHLQSSGLKVLRVWGFNDITSPTTGVWFQSFISGQPVQINTGANGLQRLDYVVSSAEAHDIKLIINFVNEWGDYGGMAAYTSYYGGTATEWYTNTQIQAQYQTYIKAVVSRYQTSTAIFGWELANEPRCSGCDPNTIYNWAATTSKYIKSLDLNHMVAIGDEGFMASGGDGSYPYTIGAGGYDFVQNLNISTLDYGTFHLYPDSWNEPYSWGDPWITNHAAACAAAGKPCLLEEYGALNTRDTVEEDWENTALNTPGIGGDLFWQDGDTLSTGQTNNDGYAVYYGSSDWTLLVTDHVAAINAKYPSGGSSPPPTSTSSKSTSTTKPPTSSTTSTAPPHSTSTTSGGASPHWGQCGGIGYTGPTTCVTGTTCTYSNPYYSQCL